MSTYVYGIVRAGHPALGEHLTGVGDPPPAVRVLREGTVAALVSDCAEEPRPKRRHLLAHQQVLQEAGAGGPVLPLRFGSVSADDGVVLAELAQRADFYREQLDGLVDMVEYNVKAAHREESVLRLVVTEDPEVRALRDANRAAGGGSYQDRLRLGELVARGVSARQERDAHTVEEALAPHAERRSPGPESAGWLLNLSLLLRRAASAGFLDAVDELREANPQLDLTVNGPLPPYSFVRTTPASTPAEV